MEFRLGFFWGWGWGGWAWAWAWGLGLGFLKISKLKEKTPTIPKFSNLKFTPNPILKYQPRLRPKRVNFCWGCGWGGWTWR